MLRELIEENKNMSYEIYINKNSWASFHTDYIDFLASDDVNYFAEIGVDFEKVLDLDYGSFEYEIMNREDYENSVIVNASEEVTDEEFPILVISINQKVIDKLINEEDAE